MTAATARHTAEPFAPLSAPLVRGGTVNLPTARAGAWSVVLFSWGHWCPYCRTQLADFRAHVNDFAGVTTRIVALSVDRGADAQGTVTQDDLTFPVASGLDPQDAAPIGNEWSSGQDARGVDSNATGFVLTLTPDGRVALALYSTGATGRLNAPDILRCIKYAQGQG